MWYQSWFPLVVIGSSVVAAQLSELMTALLVSCCFTGIKGCRCLLLLQSAVRRLGAHMCELGSPSLSDLIPMAIPAKEVHI